MSPNEGMKRQKEEKEPEASTSKDQPNLIESRKRITGEPLRVLEESYANNPNPKKEDRKRLAAETGLTYKQVRGWFIRKRHKLKKLNGETIHIPAKRVRKENKKNPSATKLPIKRDSNVVPPNEMTTMDNAVIVVPVESVTLTSTLTLH